MDATTAAAISIKFETESCGRCGGTGYYGPTCVNGGRCFKCGGGKTQRTRAGEFARKAFNAIVEANTAPVATLEVGQKIKWAGSWYGVLTAPESTESGKVGQANVKLEIFNRREGGRKLMIMGAEDAVILWDADVWVAAATRVARLKGAMVEGL